MINLFNELGGILNPKQDLENCKVKPKVFYKVIKMDITSMIIEEIKLANWEVIQDPFLSKKVKEIWETIYVNGKEYEIQINFNIKRQCYAMYNSDEAPYYRYEYEIKDIKNQLWDGGKESEDIELYWDEVKILNSLKED